MSEPASPASRRIAFWGTPEVAVPALEGFVRAPDFEVAAVVTNPDRPKGRSRTPVAPPVKEAALRHDLEVWQPERPREILDRLRALDLDASAVVAYGAILPADVLAASGAGFVNLHFSLLPRWRGAAPVQHAIRAGDSTTGVTTFVLDEGMDTGPILEQEEVRIRPDETAGDLLHRLAEIGAPILVDSLRRWLDGMEPVPQPTEGATIASKIDRDDVAIDWEASADEVANLVRSANPAPGAHTSFRGDPLKVWGATPMPDATADAPGTVVRTESDGPVIATGEGAVRLDEVQPAGKSRMRGGDFVNGYQPDVGERLGA
ncbi:MAG: methionyl-tRNA formyltransferase [Nitriliruptorales bacterium]|nr:methionyl-tRNA formyltransferase [Nitriliruptorales bacterium]